MHYTAIRSLLLILFRFIGLPRFSYLPELRPLNFQLQMLKWEIQFITLPHIFQLQIQLQQVTIFQLQIGLQL